MNNTKALLDFEKHKDMIFQYSTINQHEDLAEQAKRIKKARADYGFFVEYYFPHYAKCKCGKFQITAANNIKKEQNLKAVMEWARGHAKSTHFDILIPLWLKCQEVKTIHVMVLVGKSEDNADTLLSDVQAELMANQRYIHDFGIQYQSGNWTDGEFVTKDDTAFFARGRGQSPRGLRHRESRPDYIVIDDLDDDELVNNDARVSKMVDWVLEALLGSMDMGKGRFVMVGNRIGKNSVLANFSKRPGLTHSVVNAIDEYGLPSWGEKYNIGEIKELEAFMGYRRFQKEYMNNPIVEGSVFDSKWIKWIPALPLNQYDHLVAYCDPSFKNTTKNDYKAIKLWGKKGTDLHLIDCMVDQCSVITMVAWFYDLHERKPQNVIIDYMMEASFMQDMLLDEFVKQGNIRGYQLPIRPDTRKKPDKFQRIEALSPLYERGVIYYNERKQQDRHMITALDQLLSFEKGNRTADDSPDADEGAIYYLQMASRMTENKASFGKRRMKTIY
jgi:predicted phage terminase large subunit-like protein